MANPNAPLGFQFRGTRSGVANAQVIRCHVPASDGTALFLGDAVKANNTTDTATGLPEVIAAGAADVVMGVVVGVNPIVGVAIGSENLNRVYRPASTAYYLDVNIDPMSTFEIQSSGTVASTDMGKYANLTAAVAGNTTTGNSGMQLNESSVTATRAGAQMLILQTIQDPTNAVDAANTRLLVQMVNQLTGT